MKQIIQDIRNGKTLLTDVPVPKVEPGTLLIKTTASLVSLGTERMLVEFGQAGFLQKAKQQPEKVREVFDKMKTDGVLPTVDAVFNKLNHPLPLGYCNVGIVEEVGSKIRGFRKGDRVASNGPHAEYVCIPENLAVKIPEGVSDDEATFTVVSSIALQGIRLIEPTFGETIVVVGLGLIGQLTVQLLKAHGCRAIGYDFDPQKVTLAKKFGITAFEAGEGRQPDAIVNEYTGGIGADGVIITASAKGDRIVHDSARMCRKRGRIVLVGVVNLELNRNDFYEKEISFQVSCSYGPGRYDDAFEQKGQDYPIGFVRWTENRNFLAVLHAIKDTSLDVKPLITERLDLPEFMKIYGDMRKKGSIASILHYSNGSSHERTVEVSGSSFDPSKGITGIIGAGNFTSSMIIPTLKKIGVQAKYIASAKGLSAVSLAKKGGILKATADSEEILNDPEVTLVLITTRHNLHASMVLQGLEAGKHVFVEKPLCLKPEELDKIVDSRKVAGKMVVVGFNRRFSPFAVKMKELLGERVMNIVATMNAGFIPRESWVHDLEEGGGRILGEACHYFDLCTYLTGSKIVSVCMNALGENPDAGTDNASILLKYASGSSATIHYFANGSKKYTKERIEVHSLQKTMVIDNWRALHGYGIKGFRNMSSRQNKGHVNQFRLLYNSVEQSGVPIIPFDEIVNTTKATFASLKSLQMNEWVEIRECNKI